MPSIYAWELVMILKLNKTLNQTHVKDKTKQHIMLLKTTTDKMHDTKQLENKTETQTQEKKNIAK